MIESILIAAYIARFAAGGLLVVAAAGKAARLVARPTVTHPWAIAGLATLEAASGVALFLPVSGLPLWLASTLFVGFAGVQVVGRSVGADRPCECYGNAAPNAVFSYVAVVAFVLIAGAIATTAVVAPPASEAAMTAMRVTGIALAALMLGLIRRNSRRVSASITPSST